MASTVKSNLKVFVYTQTHQEFVQFKLKCGFGIGVEYYWVGKEASLMKAGDILVNPNGDSLPGYLAKFSSVPGTLQAQINHVRTAAANR